MFQNLKYYDSHLIMQELGKFNLKISVIPNGLKMYITFDVNNRLSFIDSFHFLNSSLHSLVKKLNKDDLRKKAFILMSIWVILPSKEKFYISLSHRNITDKEYEHVLNVSKKFEMKTMKYCHDLKCHVLL